MRSKKLLEILDLLPDSPETNLVKQTLQANAAKTASFILRVKKWGRYILEVYLIISWVLQYLGIL